MKKVKKPWGEFIQFTKNKKSTVKILIVKQKERLSLQKHKRRAEFWYVLEGNPSVVVGNKTNKYKPGDTVKIRKGMKHRIINNTKRLVKVLEIATGDFDEKDITRYEDKYHRVG